MPINTMQAYVRDQLDGTILPLGMGRLDAFISPPNPRDDPTPAAYVWGSHGAERRLTLPRAQFGDLTTGGDKELTHRLSVWLVWFVSTEDAQQDIRFPGVIDAVMARLRNAPLIDGDQHVYDPITGQASQIAKLGEDMSWEYGPVRATADQRYMRQDALLTVDIVEIIQS